MPKFTYRGDAEVLFSQYLDITNDPPVTLRAVPGETYDIKQAEGYEQIQPDGQFEPAELPMPPSDAWEAADKTPAGKKQQAPKDSKESD